MSDPYSNNVVHIQNELGSAQPPKGPLLPPSEPTDESMNVRIAKLEEAVKGLRDSVNVTLAVVGIVVLILLYGIARVDQLSERVNEIPSQIGAELRDITRTLAESITAAKQQPSQIILVPSPAQSAPAQPSNNQK